VMRAETFIRRVLELAGEHERGDLRRRGLRTLLWLLEVRLELDEAAEVLEAIGPPADDVLERARTRHAEAALLRLQGRLDEAAAGFDEARSLYNDAGLVSDAMWVGVYRGWIAFVQDDLDAAERAFRDGVRVFGANEDFGRLCEAERALAEVLLERGRVDEAEKLALSARVHVGNHDVTSSTSTLRTLGLVRAAQGRADEAELILREALAKIEGTDCRLLELASLASLSRFLHGLGRDSEAEELDARLPERIPGWLNEVERYGAVAAREPTV